MNPLLDVASGGAAAVTCGGDAGDGGDADYGRTPRALRVSVWFRLARVLLQPRVSLLAVLLVVAAAVVPARHALSWDYSASELLYVPRDSESVRGYQSLADAFGPGTLSPYALLISNGTSAHWQSYFVAAQAAVVKFVALASSQLEPRGVRGILYLGGVAPTLADIAACEESPGPPPSAWCAELLLARAQYVSAKGTAMYLDVSLTVDPRGVDGGRWLTAARAAIGELRATTGLQVYLAGAPGGEWDTVRDVYGSFFDALVVTLSIVFVFVAVAFRSIVVPLRAVATIALTLAVVFGLVAIVYQYGGLDWVGVPALSGAGICWIPPLIVFSVIAGLGLDFDMFLLMR